MTAGAITPKLVSLAWPLVVGNLLQTAYNLADMFWVGRVGPEAVAAISLMFPTAWMFVSIAMGLTAASVALVSQHVGAGDDRAADNVVAQTLLLTVAVAVVLSVFGYAVRHPLLELIGAEGQVYAASLAYLEVLFVTIPFTFLFFVFRAVLRGDWGVRLRIGDLRPDWPVLKRIVSVGSPATVDGALRSVAAVAMAALVARFGPIPTAAYGVGLRLMSVSWTVSGAVGQATATGVGQNLGAETPGRAAEVTWKGTAGTMAILFGAGALMLAFPAEAMRIFIADPDVVSEGVVFLRVIAPFLAFFGGLMVIQGGFRGAGDTGTAMVLSFLSRWIFRIPLAVILAYQWTASVGPVALAGLSWGPIGLWWAWSAAAAASFLLGAAWFRLGNWQEGVVEQAPSASPGD
ncbi:MATE family efflux transporter [Halobacteriales archaeon QS_1_67_19]|nr:MAG: MATE family efflux transporter [Halobacteriales archaeon QS_1_67_19]